jgi:AcrR family transcriptional regulator/DNA-binding MarR family transcriptional regulator
MFDVAAERGAGGVSVSHVVERSGVSRRTFYEVFSDREDCFLAAFDDALIVASERVLPAYRAGKSWRDRVRAGLTALLVFLDEQPIVARLLIVESLSGGSGSLERRDRVLARVASAVDEGRAQSAGALSLSPLTAEGLVGGALSLVHARIVRAERESLVELTNQLMSMIVLPYLGTAAARRELERPVVVGVNPVVRTPPLTDPFKEMGMRLTYRTVRVLEAIADNPQASNRTIGDSAGITDQGQVSKLLARLQRIGLITNTGLGPGQGAPNAWTLTPKGHQITHTIHTHTNNPEENAR